MTVQPGTENVCLLHLWIKNIAIPINQLIRLLTFLFILNLKAVKSLEHLGCPRKCTAVAVQIFTLADQSVPKVI